MRRGNLHLATISGANVSENATSKATEVTARKLITLHELAVEPEHNERGSLIKEKLHVTSIRTHTATGEMLCPLRRDLYDAARFKLPLTAPRKDDSKTYKCPSNLGVPGDSQCVCCICSSGERPPFQTL